jgi:hypothetical protein
MTAYEMTDGAFTVSLFLRPSKEGGKVVRGERAKIYIARWKEVGNRWLLIVIFDLE